MGKEYSLKSGLGRVTDLRKVQVPTVWDPFCILAPSVSFCPTYCDIAMLATGQST